MRLPRTSAVRLAAISAGLLSAAALLPSQTTDDDIVLKAMRDEMERSRQLRAMGGLDLPYFFDYSINDSENLHVSATLGSPVRVSHSKVRVPDVDVRVGSYDFDDTGHIYSGRYTGSGFDEGWPLDDNYTNLRENLWLATDRAYKTAIESMGRKKASLNSAAASTDKLPDFSKADPVVGINKIEHKKVDEAVWTNRIEQLSAIFKAYPEVLSSGVEFESIKGTTYLLNSEGTTLRYADDLHWLYAKAEGQAPGGMLVHDAASIQALEIDQLPSEPDLKKAMTDVAENVRALVKAPIGEAYTGPVLFEPRAAAQLFAQLLGDNLRVPRKPITDPGRNVNFLPSELETRFGSRVLPDWLDVTDDATQTAANGKPLIGFYLFDSEGVRPKPVPVIQKGVLRNFLTTRQPIKNSTGSNGHARLGGGYGTHGAAIGNLFVKAEESEPMAALKTKMLQMIKDANKPYGMLVRKLDFPFSGSGNELGALAQASSQSGGSTRPVSPPVLLYRVYPDGHEELVRGLRFRGVSTRSLRDIMAATQETALVDFVGNGAPLAFLGAGGYLAPSSIVSPGLLFEELEFEAPRDELPKEPVVPPPPRATQ
jgi:TldD protein